MYDHVMGQIRFRLIHAVTELGIADHIASGIHGVDELADTARVDADVLHRVLRALASFGVFVETKDRHYDLTDQAQLIRNDPRGTLRDFVLYFGSDWRRRTWDQLPETLRTGEPCFDLAFGEPVFEYLQKHPEKAAVYNNVQASNSALVTPQIANACNFSRFETLMDVGGGHGYLLAEILKATPRLKGILFDMPGVSKEDKGLLEREGVADRCTIEEGSFFDGLPAGADAIIMKSIIHDWDDDKARRILRNCREAVGPDGKVLVCEVLLPGGNEASIAKLLDLEMLAISGGRERTEQEFRDLFESAGLKLEQIIPTRTGASVLELSVSPGGRT
jgi:hypothetical protein